MTRTKLAVLTGGVVFALAVASSPKVSLAAEFRAEATSLPYPPDARELQFVAWAGDIKYESHSPLKSLAAFYLKEMADRGWEHDESEVEIDEDSIELTFKHGESEVELDLSQWSKAVHVSLDCKGLKFTDTDNPAQLVALGIPVPRAAVFFQQEIPLPDSFQDLKYDGDGCMLKSSMKLQQAFDYFSGHVRGKGFRESRRPITTDSRRYTEFKKGSVEVSVNVFKHDVGSRIVLEYEDQRGGPPVPPLPAVASLSIGNPGSSDASGAGETAAMPVVKTPINVVNNKGQASVRCGGKQYTFSHVACFQTKDRGSYATEVVFAAKPIPLNKMQSLVSTKDDFSFGDLYEFDFPDYLIIQLGDYRNLTFSADGVGIGGYKIENPTGELKIESGRVTGTLQMPPKEILNRQFSFTVKTDVAIITPTTRFSSGTEDPIEQSTNPILTDSPVPMPDGVEDLSRQGSKFRMVYSAMVGMPLADVTAFYRKELVAQGWKQADANSTSGVMQFSNSTTEMSVALKRQGNKTAIEAVVREVALAKQKGILPEPGQGRLALANAHNVDVVFTIGKTDYPLKAGRGAKDFKQTLNYSLSPGTYTVIIKIPGQQPQTENIELTAGSTWSIIALPTGGYLPMQMY